ncbi:pilus assembly protein TadG-related protein [Pyxidicoccus sp. MSG2]|uniref:pilus assembly protein TadG-related protein n=1 Tax=Pyxidicoccus sp. MSG2 TaxID=2996790 RepID=UPI00226D784B|nr:pilus assembly protein TadG-related protein [Pyxidicoccus sp. MSG2]MCY1017677.1 pilus assembly protein TadG-related protein [Pyxidicoccus sp. MSG2]
MNAPRFSSLRRGQTMVLFVLSMLLVVLMVVLTLSYSMKVRERIEVQTVADAAAYTNAVATARTFNNIAVLNRVQIGHAVAQAGAQSIISWTTMYRAYLNGARSSFSGAKWPYQLMQILCACAPFNGGCARACRCGNKGVRDLNSMMNAFRTEDRIIDPIFRGADVRAGLQLLLHQTAQLAIYASQHETYDDLVDSLGDQQFAKEITDQAAPGGRRGEWRTPGGLTLNRSELRGGMACTDSGALCDLPLTVAHAVNAAMGSRGYRFVTHRNYEHYLPHMIRLLVALLRSRLTGFLILTGQGTAYFKQPAGLGTMDAVMNMLPPYGSAVTAQDEGTILGIYPHILNGGGLPCPPIMPGPAEDVQAEVVGSGIAFRHRWTGGSDPMPFVHFLVPCTGGISSCPGIWPAFVDYNTLGVVDEDDNYAQPKNFALVQRDMATRTVADPWNFMTRFRFKSSGPGTEFDSRGLTLADGTPNSVQTALATGITYYHRGESLGIEHWAEPPNLLNPYWRATLVAPDIDDSGMNDASNTLRSASGVAADTFDALRGVGFKGIQ